MQSSNKAPSRSSRSRVTNPVVAPAVYEALEARRMLAAQAVGSVPSQALTVGTTPAAITLSTYLDDSVIPAGDTVVEMHTSLPAPNNVFPLILSNAATPKTVANFLSYISKGEYTNTIIHRSIPGFIVQGGAFNTSGGSLPTAAAIPSEASTAVFKNSTVGTIAMALQSGPDSAATGTDSWFFNLADNSALDTAANNQGPFTAFGEVIYNGDAALNAIAAVPVYNASSSNGAWANLPLQNFSGGSFSSSNFVSITAAVDSTPLTYSVSVVPTGSVTATITNGSLQLAPVAAGTATVTVTATDLGGGTAKQVIPVTVTAPVTKKPLSGTVIGTAGSYNNDGNTIAKAFDGNLSTFFDGPTANGNWAGLDLGTAQQITSVSYCPRSGYAGRMVGGVFQGSSSANFSSGVVNLLTVTATPAQGALTSAAVTATGSYRYVRYLSPNGSYGDVAEVQFFGGAAVTHTQLTGTAIGTSGSYQNDGNTIAKALDGNLSTFFDGPTANGNWVGIDTGSAHSVTEISYAPRSGFASRMVGGIFQASNDPTFSTGVVNLYTVTTTPATGALTTVSVSATGTYRYFRYLSPSGSYGDVAEVQFFS